MKDRRLSMLNLSLRGSAPGAWLLAAQASSLLGGFVFWHQATNALPASIVAPALAINALLPLLTVISALGMAEGLIRFSLSEPLMQRRVLWKLVPLSLSVAISVAIIFDLLLFPEGTTLGTSALLLLALIGIPATFSSHFDAANMAAGRPWIVFLSATASAVIKVGFIHFLPTSEGILLGMSLGAIAAFLVSSAIYFRRAGRPPANSISISGISTFSAVNWLASIASIAAASTLPALVLSLSGPEEASVLAILLLIASGLSLPASTFARLFLAEASRDLRVHNLALKKNILLAYSFSLVGIVVLVSVLGTLLQLFGPLFLDLGKEPLLVLALAVFLSIPNYFIDAELNFRKRKVAFLVVNVLGSGILFTSVLFSASLGLEAVAYSWLFSQLAYSVVGLLVLAAAKPRPLGGLS